MRMPPRQSRRCRCAHFHHAMWRHLVKYSSARVQRAYARLGGPGGKGGAASAATRRSARSVQGLAAAAAGCVAALQAAEDQDREKLRANQQAEQRAALAAPG